MEQAAKMNDRVRAYQPGQHLLEEHPSVVRTGFTDRVTHRPIAWRVEHVPDSWVVVGPALTTDIMEEEMMLRGRSKKD